MKYMTTGAGGEIYDTQRAFCAEEQGMGTFFPVNVVPFTVQERLQMERMDLADCMAFVLNRFCDREVFGWNIGLWAGRTPLRIVLTKHKTYIAELWHNSGWSFSYLEQVLYSVLGLDEKRSYWAGVSARIAVLWGTYMQLISKHGADRGEVFDVVVREGDLSWVLAASYAEEMGLPLGSIVCGCSENSSMWELFNYGQMHMGESTASSLGLEHLLYRFLGPEARVRFVAALQQKSVFDLTEEEQELLQRKVFISVLGKQRVRTLMGTVKECTMGEDTAISYGALQYYRAARGGAAMALVLSEDAPENGLTGSFLM